MRGDVSESGLCRVGEECGGFCGQRGICAKGLMCETPLMKVGEALGRDGGGVSHVVTLPSWCCAYGNPLSSCAVGPPL